MKSWEEISAIGINFSLAHDKYSQNEYEILDWCEENGVWIYFFSFGEYHVFWFTTEQDKIEFKMRWE